MELLGWIDGRNLRIDARWAGGSIDGANKYAVELVALAPDVIMVTGIREIAAAEKINESYVGRVLRLTLLAPDVVEAILDGRQPGGLQLDGSMRRFPLEWTDQRLMMSTSSG